MNQFLQDRIFMQERLQLGIDVHPSDAELREFKSLAKEIDPDRYFTLYGCQKCVNELVKFVFDNQGAKIKSETFPKHKKKGDGKEQQANGAEAE